MIAALAMLASSLWLLAVESAGHVMSRRWAEGGRMDGASWLSELAIYDPRMALKAGEQCMATAVNQQVCRSYLERALRGSPRLTGAQTATILLAEKGKELAEAAHMLQRLKRSDGSFAVQWLDWNFHLRNGTSGCCRNGTREILTNAPATFRGDFPLLPLTGMRTEEIVEAMLQAGASGRALDYAKYRFERDDPGAGDVFVDLLTQVDRALAREVALRFIAERVGDRRGFKQAARVWTELVRSDLVEDRRASPDDDPVVNPNPRLLMPFVQRSFDWSAAENQWASVSRSGGNGVSIKIRRSAPAGMPLLSKLLLLPENTTGIRLRMCVAHPELWRFVWKIYDAPSDRVIVSSSPGGRPSEHGCRVFDLPLAGAHPEAVYAILSIQLDKSGTDETLAMHVSETQFEMVH